ncbi:MAG: 2-succinyl-5-enolpyruvyl-6-hydroxy-3-cyclohexene-1-carboxylic-acid synthase [candidate division Zixibacteria bacterium]|nr:2-succinyl-5-enolpyruvyl-6-hydroxy-3-cyclohexene-1-carboxylic-acid synthase [candidate division Zixibacteria bacterium]
MIFSTANINSVWAGLLIEELSRHNITQFYISPGSRSTPLVAAVAQNSRAESVIHFDERGAAFCAIGYARAARKAAVLICTSGTAVAEYFPSVIEASMDNLPLIILSADRPTELHDVGANQTIHQAGLFGRYARHSIDLPCPDIAISSLFVLATVDYAVRLAHGSEPGPVHINCRFREPLAPIESGEDFLSYLKPVETWSKNNNPNTRHQVGKSTCDKTAIDHLASEIGQSSRGLVIVGQLRTKEERESAALLCKTLDWPVFADVTSGLYFGFSVDSLIVHYDLFLGSEVHGREINLDFILHIGGQFVSRMLQDFIAQTRPVHFVQIDSVPRIIDPSHQLTQRIEADIATFCAQLLTKRNQSQSRLTGLLTKSSEISQQIICGKFSKAEALTDVGVVFELSKQIADNSGLFLASSMPIRLMNMYGSKSNYNVTVGSNRGVSGIDGTIASAVGFAQGLGQPVTLLIGDLAFLYDLNSLALVKQSSQQIIIVILNNNGGGIFAHLPIAKFDTIFEKYFITPHNLSFEHAAKLFLIPYVNPRTRSDFVNQYQQGVKSGKSAIIEITLDREKDMALHKAIVTEVSEKLSQL